MQRNVVLLSKTIVAQHFKLLTVFKLLTLQDHCGTAFQVAHLVIVAPDKGAAITVKLFDQTLLADMEMFYIKETVFGVRDGAQLMDYTHPCLVALAAASHWPQQTHWPSHTGCNSACLQSSL